MRTVRDDVAFGPVNLGCGDRSSTPASWRRSRSSNLDPTSPREHADVLRGLDITILMATHDLPYAVELCERAVALFMARHHLELPVGFSL